MEHIDDITIESASHIHFLTNSQATYVRIKNIVTNKYIDIIESFEEVYDNIVICDDYGVFVKLQPCYDLYKMYMIACVPNKACSNEHIERSSIMSESYLFARGNSSFMKDNGDKTIDSMFMLERVKNGFYIKTTNTTSNIYGDDGRYLYITDDMCVHVDGDRSISTALWTFEKINDVKMISDIRTDYEKDLEKITSSKNMKQLFKNTFKYFTIKNRMHNKYITAFIHSNEQPTQNGLIGASEPTQFVIRPIQSESNCVYISYYINGLCYNMYTLPRNNNVYLGAPDCNWAKFYIIEKSSNTFMFQVFHRECDDMGNYGRYLCMRQNDEQNKQDENLFIMSNGSETDKYSLWNLINMCT